MSDRTICYTPIGYVENEFDEWTSVDELREAPMRIVLRPDLEPGLLQLAAGDWILVLFHFNQIDEVKLQLFPRDDISQPLHGVFATRTQYRPNPIGATVAQVERIDANVLHVRRLDALNGTPVLDIKRMAANFDYPDVSDNQGDADA